MNKRKLSKQLFTFRAPVLASAKPKLVAIIIILILSLVITPSLARPGIGYGFTISNFSMPSSAMVDTTVTASFSISGSGFMPSEGYIEKSTNGGASYSIVASFDPHVGFQIVQVNVGSTTGHVLFRVKEMRFTWAASVPDTVNVTPIIYQTLEITDFILPDIAQAGTSVDMRVIINETTPGAPVTTTNGIIRRSKDLSIWNDVASFNPHEGENLVSVPVLQVQPGQNITVYYQAFADIPSQKSSIITSLEVYVPDDPAIKVVGTSLLNNGQKGVSPATIQIDLESTYDTENDVEIFVLVKTGNYVDFWYIWISESISEIVPAGTKSDPSTVSIEFDLPISFFNGIRTDYPTDPITGRYALNAGDYEITHIYLVTPYAESREPCNLLFTISPSNVIFGVALFEDEFELAIPQKIDSHWNSTDYLDDIFVTHPIKLCDFQIASYCYDNDTFSIHSEFGMEFLFDIIIVDIANEINVSSQFYFDAFDSKVQEYLGIRNWDTQGKTTSTRNHGLDLYLGFATIPDEIVVAGSTAGRRSVTFALDKIGTDFGLQMKLSMPRTLHETLHQFKLVHPDHSGYIMGGIEESEPESPKCSTKWQTDYWCMHPISYQLLETNKLQHSGIDIFNSFEYDIETDTLDKNLFKTSAPEVWPKGNAMSLVSFAQNTYGSMRLHLKAELKPDSNDEISVSFYIKANDTLALLYSRKVDLYLFENGNAYGAIAFYLTTNDDWIFISHKFDNLDITKRYDIYLEMNIPDSDDVSYGKAGFTLSEIFAIGGIRFES